jgi:Ca2+-dependent lipid-binding protein
LLVEAQFYPNLPSPHSICDTLKVYDSGIFKISLFSVEMSENSFGDVKRLPTIFTEIYDMCDTMRSSDQVQLETSNSLSSKKEIENLSLSSYNGYENVNLLARSQKVKNSFAPIFNESYEFFVKDVENSFLLFLIKDQEKETSDHRKRTKLLGKVEINLKSIFENNSEYLVIVDREGNTIGKINCSCQFIPVAVEEEHFIKETELEATNSGTLQLTLVGANDLPAVDHSGTSDPFCLVKVNDEKVHKSKVIKKNLNPR